MSACNPYKRRAGAEGTAPSDTPPSVAPGDAPPAKRQKSLHTFFGGTDTTVPPYFCLLWPTQALFLPSLPPELQGGKALFMRDVEWRDQKKTITLCANIPSAEMGPDGIHPALGRETVYSNVSFLKSHLQKCVRRRRGRLAARTAVHLMRLSMGDFLRRLPIIMIEDAMLHRQLPVLVWLMVAASKGFVPNSPVIEWLLGLVELVADGEVRDIAPRKSAPFSLTKAVPALPDTELRSIIYALQLRRSYGGMGGDMAMLDASSHIWLERFAKGAVDKDAAPSQAIADMSREVVPIELQALAPLQPHEWDLAAIDFHCSNIDAQLQELLPGLAGGDTGLVRSLIWRFSSSVTRKTAAAYSVRAGDVDECGEDAERWQAMERTFKLLAMSILERSK